MKGIELSEKFYNEVVKPYIAREFSDYENALQRGLRGTALSVSVLTTRRPKITTAAPDFVFGFVEKTTKKSVFALCAHTINSQKNTV